MAKKDTEWTKLYKTEDWWAVWVAFFILLIASMGILTVSPRIKGWAYDPFKAIQPYDTMIPILLGTLIGMGILTSIACAAMKVDLKKYVPGFIGIFFLALIALALGEQVTIAKEWGLAGVLWALFIGLFLSNVLGFTGFNGGAKTELFIKIGLVLLGAEILFGAILKAGSLGMVQALIVIVTVYAFTVWLGNKVGLDKSFTHILSSAVSVCGVSAAIAAGGAVKGKPAEVSYTVSIVLLCAMPMLVFMPILAKFAGMSEVVTGAWLGGTIDTTGAVVAAGAIYGQTAMEVASIIKMTQNVLIGVLAFVLATFWVVKVDRKPDDAPSLFEIWVRFPKFIVGFLAASVFFSLVMTPSLGEAGTTAVLDVTKVYREWFFTLAFVSIGLDTRFMELVKIGGGKPAFVFLVGQAFNILVCLLAAWLLFGGVLFPAPL